MIGMSTRTFLLIDDGIDIDVDLLGARRERIEAAGDAVVEARADVDHHVAIVHRHVGFVGAVHAEHAEPLLVGGGIGAEAHQRRGDREAGQMRTNSRSKLARLRAGIDDAAAGVEDRPLALAIRSTASRRAGCIALDARR